MFIVPAYTRVAKIIIIVVSAILFITSIALILITTLTNSADDNVQFKPGKILPTFIKTKERPKVINKDNFCYICQVSVSPTAKHCRLCNKCVVDFDHHCRYLNTCIGGKNYKKFIATLVSVIVLSVFNITTFFYVTYQAIAISGQALNNLVNQYGPQNTCINPDTWWRYEVTRTDFSRPGWQGVVAYLSLVILLEVVVLVSVLNLFIFHIKIIYTGQTTYSFIISKRKKKEQKEAERKKKAMAAEMEGQTTGSDPSKKSTPVDLARTFTAKSFVTNFSTTENSQCFQICLKNVGEARTRKTRVAPSENGNKTNAKAPSVGDVNLIYDRDFDGNIRKDEDGKIMTSQTGTSQSARRNQISEDSGIHKPDIFNKKASTKPEIKQLKELNKSHNESEIVAQQIERLRSSTNEYYKDMLNDQASGNGSYLKENLPKSHDVSRNSNYLSHTLPSMTTHKNKNVPNKLKHSIPLPSINSNKMSSVDSALDGKSMLATNNTMTYQHVGTLDSGTSLTPNSAHIYSNDAQFRTTPHSDQIHQPPAIQYHHPAYDLPVIAPNTDLFKTNLKKFGSQNYSGNRMSDGSAYQMADTTNMNNNHKNAVSSPNNYFSKYNSNNNNNNHNTGVGWRRVNSGVIWRLLVLKGVLIHHLVK